MLALGAYRVFADDGKLGVVQALLVAGPLVVPNHVFDIPARVAIYMPPYLLPRAVDLV